MAMLAEAKKRTVRINGCVASAQAAKYADVDVIAAYPIRPYTATMMALAQMVANGELDAEYIVADSEHSQLSIAHGAASSGARVFTGSSGVGVQFAYELYSPISGSRMPVQMMIADRTLDPPGDFGSEHTDALSTRDMGWIMGWSCDAQEAFRQSPDRLSHRRGPARALAADGLPGWFLRLAHHGRRGIARSLAR
jgi:pyruvate ferredoxin oxidoreductase alpha subunit